MLTLVKLWITFSVQKMNNMNPTITLSISQVSILMRMVNLPFQLLPCIDTSLSTIKSRDESAKKVISYLFESSHRFMHKCIRTRLDLQENTKTKIYPHYLFIICHVSLSSSVNNVMPSHVSLQIWFTHLVEQGQWWRLQSVHCCACRYAASWRSESCTLDEASAPPTSLCLCLSPSFSLSTTFK